MDPNDQLKKQLTPEELLLVNSQVEKHKKNSTVAHLLWWFTGMLGGYRYYFGKYGSALIMTFIFIVGTAFYGIGAIITGVWALMDVFKIQVWLDENQQKVEKDVIYQFLMHGQLKGSNLDKQSSDLQSIQRPLPDGDHQSKPIDENKRSHPFSLKSDFSKLIKKRG